MSASCRLVTTLTDPQRYPVQDFPDLYAGRWQICRICAVGSATRHGSPPTSLLRGCSSERVQERVGLFNVGEVTGVVDHVQ